MDLGEVFICDFIYRNVLGGDQSADAVTVGNRLLNLFDIIGDFLCGM
jgi:hypothetical protein